MNHIFTNMLSKEVAKDLHGRPRDPHQAQCALHHKCTQWVLQCLQEHGLSIKLSKCVFDAPHMEFLGMIIGQGEDQDGQKEVGGHKRMETPHLS